MWPTMSTKKRVVLVGGGHAHVQVIKALNTHARPADMEVVLIDPQCEASYSGMVPGCVSGLYTEDETKIKLQPLADWAGLTFINHSVEDIDLGRRTLFLPGGHTVGFDVVSIDIGSTTRGFEDVPGAKKYTVPTRPISALNMRIGAAAKQLLAAQDPGSEKTVSVAVVGGGAAGIELAFGMKARWKSLLADAAHAMAVQVTLLNRGDRILAGESDMCRRALEHELTAHGILVRHKCSVAEVCASSVRLSSGEEIASDCVIWATGASCHPLASKLQSRGLAADQHGWLQVGPNLQSLSCPAVFAAGDCSTIVSLNGNPPPPKAGVYAVRSGPILIHNLVNYVQGKALVNYAPQADFLRLLMCGDGTALGFRFGIAFSGQWVWKLKDHIDVMFMNLFKEEYLPKSKAGSIDTAQYDAKKMDDYSAQQIDCAEAAQELLRTDDQVDYLQNWAILRRMMVENPYKEAVLECVHSAAT
eukprot:COSAG01_NODE_5745_length_4062_cov_1.625284_2_plen_473_part_00